MSLSKRCKADGLSVGFHSAAAGRCRSSCAVQVFHLLPAARLELELQLPEIWNSTFIFSSCGRATVGRGCSCVSTEDWMIASIDVSELDKHCVCVCFVCFPY